MLEPALRPSQAEPQRMEVLTSLLLLCLAFSRLSLGVSDDFGETERGVVGFGDAEILEGGDAGVESENGLVQWAAAGAQGIRFLQGIPGRLHLGATGKRIEYYNQYRKNPIA